MEGDLHRKLSLTDGKILKLMTPNLYRDIKGGVVNPYGMVKEHEMLQWITRIEDSDIRVTIND